MSIPIFYSYYCLYCLLVLLYTTPARSISIRLCKYLILFALHTRDATRHAGVLLFPCVLHPSVYADVTSGNMAVTLREFPCNFSGLQLLSTGFSTVFVSPMVTCKILQSQRFQRLANWHDACNIIGRLRRSASTGLKTRPQESRVNALYRYSARRVSLVNRHMLQRVRFP